MPLSKQSDNIPRAINHYGEHIDFGEGIAYLNLFSRLPYIRKSGRHRCYMQRITLLLSTIKP